MALNRDRYLTSLDDVVFELGGAPPPRRAPVLPDGGDESLRARIANLDSAISKAPRLRDNLRVFRLVSADVVGQMTSLIGVTWHDNRFFDVVLARDQLDNDEVLQSGDAVMDVLLPAGSVLAPLFVVPPTSPGDSLCTLPRGSRFRIMAVRPHDGEPVRLQHVHVEVLHVLATDD